MSTLGLLIITLLSAALAAVMTAIAWRVSRDERRRADARIAALAADIHADEPVHARAAKPRAVATDDLPLRSIPAPAGVEREPFHGVPALAGSRYGAVAAIGLFAVASVAAAIVWLSAGPPTAPAGPIAATYAAGEAAAPLELTALSHDRDGDRLTVRGIVRNPPSAGAVDRTDAVVSVFSREGAFIVSGRAPLRSGALNPGQESMFVVTIGHAANVGRYRISFRSEERVVPHVDKRDTDTVARARLRDVADAARQAP
jgi:hypothetical protein